MLTDDSFLIVDLSFVSEQCQRVRRQLMGLIIVH